MPKLLCLALALLIAGCSSDSRTPLEPEAVAGTYELVAIDGDPLPAFREGDTEIYSILSGTLVIALTGQVHDTVNYTESGEFGAVRRLSEGRIGSYSLSRRTVSLEYPATNESGVFSSDGLLVVRPFEQLPNANWEYVKVQ